MTTYAIGDLQGCLTPLKRLLDKLNFDPAADRLWFVGDLVNRGPESLQTLRFVRALGDSAITVLGNHDLHLLAVMQRVRTESAQDTLGDILRAHDRDPLRDWLRQLPLGACRHSPQMGFDTGATDGRRHSSAVALSRLHGLSAEHVWQCAS